MIFETDESDISLYMLSEVLEYMRYTSKYGLLTQLPRAGKRFEQKKLGYRYRDHGEQTFKRTKIKGLGYIAAAYKFYTLSTHP